MKQILYISLIICCISSCKKELDIEGCTDPTALNYSVDANVDDNSCIDRVYGCIDYLACNYNHEATDDDGSCGYPEEGGSCPQIGDLIYGGIVFYIDESGSFGLVAALEDLTYGATYDNIGNPEYEWGCYNENVQGAHGILIGTGHQNTVEIVNHGCETENGALTAAKASINYNLGGYSDWYLPSRDELIVMYNNIGIGADNSGGFVEQDYWSSSESNYGTVLQKAIVIDQDGDLSYEYKYNMNRVRLIRSFGYIEGCSDGAACNFDYQANISDNSCIYPQEGYDCDNNFSPEIGDVIQGGIVFWIDESGQHGLIAATEDMTDGASIDFFGNPEYSWECLNLQDPITSEIGFGLSNTLFLDEFCDEIPNPASFALSYENNGYSDWYLPSRYELSEMYHNIGNPGINGNVGGFENSNYWSSSSYINSLIYVNFYDGSISYSINSDAQFDYLFRVRPIRSF